MAIDRLRTASCAPGSAPPQPAQQQPAQAQQGSQQDGCTPADSQAGTAWGQAFRSWGHIDGDGNAAKLKRDIGGFVVGADKAVGADWRVGAFGGYSRTSADTDARNSSAKTDSYHLGLYGGTQWGATALRLGASQSWSKLETSRSVGFAGFADSVSAKYDSTTTQIFGDAGHRIDAAGVALEPFARLAHVRVKSDAFLERGGLARCTARAAASMRRFQRWACAPAPSWAAPRGCAACSAGAMPSATRRPPARMRSRAASRSRSRAASRSRSRACRWPGTWRWWRRAGHAAAAEPDAGGFVLGAVRRRAEGPRVQGELELGVLSGHAGCSAAARGTSSFSQFVRAPAGRASRVGHDLGNSSQQP